VINYVDFVSIGHVSYDINEYSDGSIVKNPGGAVAYASVLALNHGMKPGIITACGDDYDYEIFLPNIRVCASKSLHTTTFMNDYRADVRKQAIIYNSNKITKNLIPKNWMKPKIFFAGPLLHEIPKSSIGWIQADFSYIVPQGWFRKWNQEGIINIQGNLSDLKFNHRWDLLVLSEEESKSFTKEQLLDCAKIVCITKSSKGAKIYCETGENYFIPSYIVKDLDPTGAGDIWATAMAIKLHSGSKPIDAGYYASAAAAISIESFGLPKFLSPENIERKLQKNKIL
jgi:sugar/nucleoside kinase (ribokinase family)